MAFSRARYDANLAAGIRGGFGPGENPALMSFAQAAADAFGVSEANLMATAAASPALYALVQQLGAGATTSGDWPEARRSVAVTGWA